MLPYVNGDAYNIFNHNKGYIAGGNINIVYNSRTTPSCSIISALERCLSRRLAEQTRCPWDDWELDETFYLSLSKYIKDHPEGRLDQMLDRISKATEASKNYLVLIPCDPFPAQSLIQALSCLFSLGITVKGVKGDAYEFVNQVVRLVQPVQLAFESNRFNCPTLGSLRNIRDLINEICTWALCLREDYQWMQVQNDNRIEKEVDEFRACLVESKEIFKSGTCAISSNRPNVFPQDQILSEIRKIRKRKQDYLQNIRNEIEEMKIAQIRKAFLAEKLDKYTVSDPSFATQGKHPCDKGTREAELTEIMAWLNSISSPSQNFLWLTGDPGCGKSAITASLAAHCKVKGVLWAQFFINRNNTETTDPNTFFPTIARQLANFSPKVEHAIHDQLQVDSTLADCMTSEQATRLFIDALAVAARLDVDKVVAVIIDGLDETDKTRLYDTADIFSRLFKSLAQYPNVKIFVSSRTEDDIRRPFARRLENTNVKRIHLDTSSSINDVAIFMRRQVERIVERYELKWEEWPTEKGMESLAAHASGLFIWAVTAVRYLQEKIEEDGRGCLHDVLTQLTGKALNGINNLYTLILISNQKKHATSEEWEFRTFRKIIGAIVVLRKPLCLDDLSALLNLRQGTSKIPVDVVHFVRRLRTILVAGIDAIDGKTVPRLHKSFFEFITDAALFQQLPLDHRFCVDPGVVEAEMAKYCIQLFPNSRNVEKKSSLQGSHLKYASQFCISHVDAAARRVSMSAAALITVDATVEDVHNRFSITRQTSRLLPWFSFDFDRSPAPFSRLTAAYQVTSERMIRATRGFDITSLAYSPDGEKIVFGFVFNRLILWNVKKGIEIAELKGHTKSVESVEFSPLGDRIVSGSHDTTVRIWNVATTQLVHVLHGHSDWVASVAFSPVKNVVASASWDQSIRLWNVVSGESIRSPLRHDSKVLSVTFSKDGNEIFSGATDGVYVWNGNTGERQLKLESVISWVQSVAISPFGDRLAAIGDRGLRFWNRTSSGFVLDDRLVPKSYSGPGSRIAFSADGKSVLVLNRCTSAPHFFVYDWSSHTKILIYDWYVNDFAFSPDGSVIFGVCGKIYISDVPRLLPVTFTFLSPDAEIIACIFSDGSIWLESPKNLPAVSKKLDGNVKNVKYLTLSSDNSLLAAVDENSVYLWDASSRKLCGSAFYTNLACITELSFLADRRTLISTHEDQSMFAWNVIDGTLRPKPIDSNIIFDTQLLLDVASDRTRDIAGARWYPAKSRDSGFWAYIDNTLIRIRPDGTMTLLPLDSN